MKQGEVAIRARGLRKVYRTYARPLDVAIEALTRRRRHGERVVLDGVDLTVHRGEVVGILGRNGAGKSTLLKILAGTLERSGGALEINGRVTAILELGSGFHPDHSGRDNIVMGGMCLGMTRREVMERMDSIIAFSELEEVIDQPFRTYSSGMQARLTFSTAIGVTPDILIIDEALAVGDVFFQAKCMNRLRGFVAGGGTLLFVSHDIGAIQQICDHAILLEHGRLVMAGDTRSVTERYFAQSLDLRNAASQQEWSAPVTPTELTPLPPAPVSAEALMAGRERFEKEAAFERTGNGWAEILNVQILQNGEIRRDLRFEDEVEIRAVIACHVDITWLDMLLKVKTSSGTEIVFLDCRFQDAMDLAFQGGGRYLFSWRLRLPLMQGHYVLMAGLCSPPRTPGGEWVFIDFIPQACTFSMSLPGKGPLGGYVSLPADLHVTHLREEAEHATD